MSQRTYNACHRAVSPEHGSPPNSFLDQLIDTISSLPDVVFTENDREDIYQVVKDVLGPWEGLLNRKAVMCEVLRVQAAFESDWNWNEGVDVNNPNSLAHIEGQETGAFQVSADSMIFDQSLRECVDRTAGRHDPLTFISIMKSNHSLAVEYCARLLRFNTTWCGTINDPDQVRAYVRRDAVAEFQTFLEPVPVVAEIAAQKSAADDAVPRDRDKIANLVRLSSNVASLDDAQKQAAADLLAYDGEIYPQDGCAITLSVLLRNAGIDVPLTYQAITLGQHLQQARNWQIIPPGQQMTGDVGSTCGITAQHGIDHVYLVLRRLNDDEMVIADNQSARPHFRFVSGQNKSPTRFFLRAT